MALAVRLIMVGGAARSGQTRLRLKPCLPPGAHFGIFSQCALAIIAAIRGKYCWEYEYRFFKNLNLDPGQGGGGGAGGHLESGTTDRLLGVDK
jgi:hypothetical protein